MYFFSVAVGRTRGAETHPTPLLTPHGSAAATAAPNATTTAAPGTAVKHHRLESVSATAPVESPASETSFGAPAVYSHPHRTL